MRAANNRQIEEENPMKKLAWLVLLLAFAVTGCHHRMRNEVQGSGKRVVQKREIAAFTSLSTEGAFNIEITCQKEPSLEVEGDDNVLPFVTAEIGNGVLQTQK